jgi:hypothetical protein
MHRDKKKVIKHTDETIHSFVCTHVVVVVDNESERQFIV